jgi:uncharacterized protein (DUF1697 family)
LRGINLVNAKRVSMARLHSVCVALGAQNVRTYIASGNVVFDSPLATQTVRSRLEAGIQREFGFEVDVFVLTAAELADVVKRNPFEGDDPRSLHVAFSFGDLDPGDVAKLQAIGRPADEAVAVVGRQIYLRLPNGFGGGPQPGLVRGKIKPLVTIRTWGTVTALDKLAREAA